MNDDELRQILDPERRRAQFETWKASLRAPPLNPWLSEEEGARFRAMSEMLEELHRREIFGQWVEPAPIPAAGLRAERPDGLNYNPGIFTVSSGRRAGKTDALRRYMRKLAGT